MFVAVCTVQQMKVRHDDCCLVAAVVDSQSLVSSSSDRQDMLNISHISSTTFPAYFSSADKDDLVS